MDCTSLLVAEAQLPCLLRLSTLTGAYGKEIPTGAVLHAVCDKEIAKVLVDLPSPTGCCS